MPFLSACLSYFREAFPNLPQYRDENLKASWRTEFIGLPTKKGKANLQSLSTRCEV